MSELVEWVVGRCSSVAEIQAGKPAFQRHSEGAQSVFGFTTARKLAKELGEPWLALHQTTLVSPAEHEQWSNGGGRRWSP